MSERYSKLSALPENLYSTGAPVIIAAGALLKDNQTGKVLAQLKIRNIQDKAIKAATVTLTPLDTVNQPLGGTVDHQYLDLSAARDTDFGQKVPVFLPDQATRAFSISVAQVIFSDNTIWTSSGAPWEPLPAPVTAESALKDRELTKQYQIKYGSDCTFMYKTEKDLWQCACGALNRQSEPSCHHCRRTAAYLSALDLEQLKADRDARLKQEAEEKAAAEEKAKKSRRLAMILVPIAVVVIVAGALIYGSMKNSIAYNHAASLLESGDYDGATAAFEALGDYKDSADQAQQAQYDKAMALVSYGETGSDEGLSLILSEGEAISSDANLSKMYYEEAIEIFEALGTYKDSRKMADSTEFYLEQSIKAGDYNNALALMDSGDYMSAFLEFDELGDYEDSRERTNLALSKIFDGIKEDFGISDDDHWKASYDADECLITVSYSLGSEGDMTPEAFLSSIDEGTRSAIEGSIEDTWHVFDGIFVDCLGIPCQVCYYLNWDSEEPVFTYPD